MERIHMNRIEGQHRIHIEILGNEISDLLDDLEDEALHYDSTRAFLSILRSAEQIFSPVVAEIRRTGRRTTSSPPICEIPHTTIEEEDACEAACLDARTKAINKTPSVNPRVRNTLESYEVEGER